MRRTSFSFALILGALAGCEADPAFNEPFEKKGTVTLSNENGFIVDSYLAVVVHGAPLATSVSYTIKGTLTASTSSLAKSLADSLDVKLTRSDDGLTAAIQLGPPPDTSLEGSIEVTVPSRINLQVGSEKSISVDGMERSVVVEGYDLLSLSGNLGSIDATNKGGNIRIQSNLPASTLIKAQASNGNITLLMPRSVSASIDAAASVEVRVSHPLFPAAVGPSKNRYSATVNGGAGAAQLVAQGTVTLSLDTQ